MLPKRAQAPPPPKPEGHAATRQKDAERKRQQATARRVVQIPPCADRQRRDKLEADLPAWLRYYFGHIFTDAFTSQQLRMIDAFRAAV